MNLLEARLSDSISQPDSAKRSFCHSMKMGIYQVSSTNRLFRSGEDSVSIEARRASNLLAALAS